MQEYLTLLQNKLENVAINDVLPLKVAWRDAIANLKCFGPRDISNLISMVSFTFVMRRHLIRLASAPFTSRLAKFAWVTFAVFNAWSKTQNLQRVSEKSGSILSRLWTRVHKIFRRCMRPLVFSNALADYLHHVSLRRYTSAIKSWSRRKSEQM